MTSACGKHKTARLKACADARKRHQHPRHPGPDRHRLVHLHLDGLTDWDKDGHTDLVATDSSGALWLYPGDAAHDTSTARVQIGTGWTPFLIAGLADFNGDGDPDITARGPGNILWLYPGTGTRTSPGAQYQMGIGW